MAPDVDRLVIAIHRHVRAHRTEIARLIAETGVPSPVLIVDLRPFLLEGPVGLSVAEAFGRFMPPDAFGEVVGGLVESGTLRRKGDLLVPSDGAIRFAERTTELQVAVIDDLWARHADAVDRLLDPAGDVVLAGAAVEPDLPLFGALTRLREPEPSGAYLLHHRLTMLRYLRADVHVAVLRAVGLTPERARVVDALWRRDAVAADSTPIAAELAESGWLDQDRSALTELGSTRREAVEAETNRRISAVLAQVPADDVADLVKLLPTLPS